MGWKQDARGERAKLRVRVQNYKPSPMKMEVALVAPAEWTIEPDVLKFEAPPNAVISRPVEMLIPKDWAAPGPRFAIAVDHAGAAQPPRRPRQ